MFFKKISISGLRYVEFLRGTIYYRQYVSVVFCLSLFLPSSKKLKFAEAANEYNDFWKLFPVVH